jgi:hypothetical protein
MGTGALVVSFDRPAIQKPNTSPRENRRRSMMKSRMVLGAAAAIVACLALATGVQAGVSGDYVEIRSCDVYTGPCFANHDLVDSQG